MSKTFIVTGGTKGIGKAIVDRLITEGYHVVAGARDTSAAIQGDSVRHVAMDVRNRGDHFRLIESALSWRGRIDGYVNCAGISVWRPLAEIDETFLDTMIETNLHGAFWGGQAAANYFRKTSTAGAIVNISSLAGKRGSANNSAYCAAKFGVNGMTQALAKELGGDRIRVNAVCPVYVETASIVEMLREANSPAGGREVRDYLAEFAASQAALKRLPLAGEVAQVVCYLLGEQASAITGQCINVDCGVLPQ